MTRASDTGVQTWSVMSCEMQSDRDRALCSEAQVVIKVTFGRQCAAHLGLAQQLPWIQAVQPQCSSIGHPALSRVW